MNSSHPNLLEPTCELLTIPHTPLFYIKESPTGPLEQSLRDDKARVEATLYAAEIGTWCWDIPKNLVTADRNLARLVYFEPVAAFQGPIEIFIDTIHHDDRSRVEATIVAAIDSFTGDYECDYRITNPREESFRWVTARGKVQRDEAGRPVQFSGVLIDITDRKRNEEALASLSRRIEEQARIFNATLSNISDLAYSFDREGRVTYANKPLQDILGLPLDQIVGRTIPDITPDRDIASRLHRQIQHAILTCKPTKGESALSNPDGSVDFYEYIFNPVVAEGGEVVAVAGSSRNITERKRAEEALRQANEQLLEAKNTAEACNMAKDRFLAVLSHELRTPLSPVLMTVTGLENDPKISPEIKEDLAMIRRNVELETRLIDDLLDISRVTSGKLKLRLQHVDLCEVMRQVCAICRPEIEAKGVELHCNCETALGRVHVDPSRIQQVLWNVLKNATKFTPLGGKITVTTECAEGWCKIQVRDNGIGIPPELLSRMFNAFEQGDPLITREFGGLGLGLAISKALMEMHQGTIIAESEGTGKGCTFTIGLPLDMINTEESAPRRQTPNTDCAPRRLRLLVVEDHQDSARTLARLLRKFGHEVKIAETVAGALELAAQEPFHLVLSDIGLPDASGYELMRELQARYGMKGIAMSGYGMDQDFQKSLEAGFSKHLVKPLVLAELRESMLQVAGELSQIPVKRKTRGSLHKESTEANHASNTRKDHAHVP